MAFNTVEFLIFLGVVYVVFMLTTDGLRWAVLVLASLYFYAALGSPALVAALCAVTVTTYLWGVLSDRVDARRRPAMFWAGVGLQTAILAGFKYAAFWLPTLAWLGVHNAGPAWPAPGQGVVIIGLSYYVFQAISYLADIQLGTLKPERHFGHFCTYMVFFPRLLQGPIERAGDFLPQLRVRYRFDADVFVSGVLLFLVGLFKKIVIADRLGLYVDAAYAAPGEFSGAELLLSTYLYAFQIYFDFSGYTDMALGVARLFNISLTQNFNAPYLATSVADFWRRWHISFSRWILDYLFKPMQFHWRQWGLKGTALALICTFLISGLWHGTGWGFLVWGGLHGGFMAIGLFTQRSRKALLRRLRIEEAPWLRWWRTVLTFHLVCLAWVFFRCDTLMEAFTILRGILMPERLSLDLLRVYAPADLLALLLIPLYLYALPRMASSQAPGTRFAAAMQSALVLLVCLSMLIFSVPNNGSEFIYFRF